MNQPPEDTKRSPHPHKRKHLRPQTRADIQVGLTRNHITEDDKHDRRDDRRSRRQQRRNKRPYHKRQLPPARVQRDGREEDRDEIHADSSQEEAEHEVACDFDQVENIVNVGGQRNGGTGKQLVEQDGNWVEPVEGAWAGAVGYALIVITFAEIPEADVVEVVETEGAGEGVDEGEFGGGGGWDYVGKVEAEEVGIADDGSLVDITDYCLLHVI